METYGNILQDALRDLCLKDIQLWTL